MKKAQSFLINENPSYKFRDLAKMSDTQLVMLIRKPYWARLKEYIGAYESVTLAGRYGAEPGDYEWEWIDSPQAVRWWQRNAAGYESLCGMVLAVARGELVELYGLVEIDENSPFWPDVIPEEVGNELPLRAKNLARENPRRSENDILFDLYRDYYRDRGLLTQDASPGQVALRRGTIREVERFRDAVKKLVERSTQNTLPSEVNK